MLENDSSKLRFFRGLTPSTGNRNRTGSLIEQALVSCPHLPWKRGPSKRARTGATSNGVQNRSQLYLLEDAGHMATYADGAAITKAADMLGAALAS